MPVPDTYLIQISLTSPQKNDLERVVTHVAFLRQGRLQLMDGWDALAEHVRLLELPARASVMVDLQQGPGVLHRREKDGRARVLFDARVAIAPPAAGRGIRQPSRQPDHLQPVPAPRRQRPAMLALPRRRPLDKTKE
jgi:hypothetical protein